jgi:glycosyltransferase involved in cell wall biosynthesis
MISLVIPSYNNLRHLKNVYASIQKHAPQAEVILLDDGSTDGTKDWIQQQACITYRSEERVGHTILYDKGIELATNDIVGILHADMIIGPLYIENMLKLTQMGAMILPASPGFYMQPQTINELIDFIVARILDQLGIAQDLMPRWGEN